MENIEQEIGATKKEGKQLPEILWKLGFRTKDEFEKRVRAERYKCKNDARNLKELTKKVCKKLRGEGNWLSDAEYKELFSLVEKELIHIQNTIKDAGRVEKGVNVDSVADDVPAYWAGKVKDINEEILREDHSEYEDR